MATLSTLRRSLPAWRCTCVSPQDQAQRPNWRKDSHRFLRPLLRSPRPFPQTRWRLRFLAQVPQFYRWNLHPDRVYLVAIARQLGLLCDKGALVFLQCSRSEHKTLCSRIQNEMQFESCVVMTTQGFPNFESDRGTSKTPAGNDAVRESIVAASSAEAVQRKVAASSVNSRK